VDLTKPSSKACYLSMPSIADIIYVVPVTHEWKIMERLGAKTLSQCRCACHKFHVNWLGTKPGAARW